MNFEKSIYLGDHQPDQGEEHSPLPQKIPSCLLPVNTYQFLHPRLNHCSDFYHHRFYLSVLELSVNGSIRCVLIKVYFTHVFSFTHIVVCRNSLFFVLPSSISLGEYT